MKKTPKHSMIQKEESKKATSDWFDYYCFNSFKMQPANARTLEIFANEWVNFATKDKKYVIIWKYPVEERGISRETVMSWAERSADVKNAHTYVKRLCAIRREEGALNRDYDGNFVSKTMPMYCEEFKNLEEWRAQLSAKLEAPPTKIVVEMKAFGDPKDKK